MSFRLVFALAPLVLSGAVDVFGQTLRLSLDDAIEMAVTNNHDVKAAVMQVDRADADVKEAFGLALPTLDLNASYTRSLKEQSFFFPDLELALEDPDITIAQAPLIPIRTEQANAFQTRLNLRQTLFNSAVFSGVGTARVYSDISRALLRATLTSTILGVKKSFYNVLLAKEIFQVTQSSFKNAEDNYREVAVLFKEGFVAEYDAISAEVRMENIRPELIANENVLANAKNILKVALGLDAARDIDVVGKLDFEPGDVPTTAVAQEMESVANSNHNVRALELQMKVNQQLIDIYQSEFLPTLELFGNYAISGQSETFSDFNTFSASQIGLELNFSLFNGFQSKARVQKSELDYTISDEQYQRAVKQAHTQVADVMSRINTALKRVEAQERTVQRAQRGYDIARVRYSEGLGSQTEINDSDFALRQAKLNRIRANYDFLIAAAELQELRGSLEQRYLEIVPRQ